MEVLSYVGINKIGEGLEGTMKCYNCGKVEEILEKGKERISDIDRIETDLKKYSDEEEKFMPLCQKCLKDWQDGKLEAIEEKWISEKNKWDYISIEK